MLKKTVSGLLVSALSLSSFAGCKDITSKITSTTIWSTAIGCGTGLALGAIADEMARTKDAKERKKLENRALGIFHQKKQFNKGKMVGLGAGCLAGLGTGLYLDLMHDDMKEELGKKGIALEKVPDASGDTKELLVKMDGDISFDPGSPHLAGVAKSNVSKLGEALTAYPETGVKIAGHTDHTGSRAANEKLSLNRAETVKDYLVKNGISSSRIQDVEGYAWDRPLAGTNANGAEPRNRRVEIRIVGK